MCKNFIEWKWFASRKSTSSPSRNQLMLYFPFLFKKNKKQKTPCLLLNYWLTPINVIFFHQCSGHKRIRKISDGPCFATSEGFRQINNVKVPPFGLIGECSKLLVVPLDTCPHTLVFGRELGPSFAWYYFLPDGQAKARQRVGETGGGGGDWCQQVVRKKGKGAKNKNKTLMGERGRKTELGWVWKKKTRKKISEKLW